MYFKCKKKETNNFNSKGDHESYKKKKCWTNTESVKPGLISDRQFFLLWLQSPKKCAKTLA